MRCNIPKHYHSSLSVRDTTKAIKDIKDTFERLLAEKLNLTRVSAPLFVFEDSGLNDNLNGVERPVCFEIKEAHERSVEIVHSLAKWKRLALKRYGFQTGEGLYADMNAIRRDEDLDNTHSVYVDQWDWEKILDKEARHMQTLEDTVLSIMDVFKDCESYIHRRYPQLKNTTNLPDEIKFISTQELEVLYPDLSPKEREDRICQTHKAVFLTQIGGVLESGDKHDGRAPDYDDWRLNGDLLFWNPVLESAFEVSSMGIRVDEQSLLEQCRIANCMERLQYQFHQQIMAQELPYTIGGGLGQSRICMFLLGKAHIGEVQASVWPDEVIQQCHEAGILLL